MIAPHILLLLCLAIPLVGFGWCWLFRNSPNMRDGGVFALALLLALAVISIFRAFNGGAEFDLVLVQFQPGLSLALNAEPLGIVFALVASTLWIATHVYGVGYMRGNNEKKQASFFSCFAFAIFATMGIAFSANLLTLFLFYELLTISTYPLVAHKETEEAQKGARVYLGILMGTSIVLFLPGVVWVYATAGTLDFVQGGILGPNVKPAFVGILLALFAFGVGKAAVMPFHRWLPAAMVAPTPVSALLHAVAVVKAGVFTILKLDVYIFGTDVLTKTGASQWLVWVAGGSIIIASLIAMSQDNLKRRLAYSTVSQLSYITLGVALANSLGVLGGGLHIVTHAFGKITLFMCAGAIYVATHKTEISQMRGLGRQMPITFTAFGIGALSIIGLPPLAGAWSKWELLLASASAGQWFAIAVLMISSLLNVAYLLPIVVRGFMPAPAGETLDDTVSGSGSGSRWAQVREAPVLCYLPPALTAFGCIVLFFYAGDIIGFMSPIVTESGR